RHCNGACYGAGLWLDFACAVLLTVPDIDAIVPVMVLRCWIKHCCFFFKRCCIRHCNFVAGNI
ncbi:hypothetical protein N6N89_27025, partial [Escherichia coli]|uniref:hypothetical protein n=1 Tax=Escherichia coli TaxID=562 RepID=UPI00234D0E91